jgi:pyridoxamine 5'-phosphate oxidase
LQAFKGGRLGPERMEAMDRGGIFAGDDPFVLAQAWLKEAEASEINDPNAIALATVDAAGLPNVRMVLLKEIEQDGGGEGAFVFYTNYGSKKGQEIAASGTAAFVMHWKSLHRQIRVRGHVEREDGPKADAYFDSRSLKSRLGAIASRQSEPLESREALMLKVAGLTLSDGLHPKRPSFWGGFRIKPVEIEFWADGAFRLHDRFRWTRPAAGHPWLVSRLSP